MIIIEIEYKNSKIQKLCTDIKRCTKEYGPEVARKLFLRMEQLKAFECLAFIPVTLPWRREKLEGYDDLWSIRIDYSYRLIIKAVNLNADLRKITIISIEEVSNHYE